MLVSEICQYIWKTQQWPLDWKRSVFILILKKDNVKECSNYHLPRKSGSWLIPAWPP